MQGLAKALVVLVALSVAGWLLWRGFEDDGSESVPTVVEGSRSVDPGGGVAPGMRPGVRTSSFEKDEDADENVVTAGSVFAGAHDHATIVGRCVAAESGQPLAGCTVLLQGRQATGYPLDWSHMGWSDPPEVITKEDGRFAIRIGLPSVRSARSGFPPRFHLTITHEERAPRFGHLNLMVLARGQKRDLGDLAMIRGAQVTISVVSDQGRPVRRVPVHLFKLRTNPDEAVEQMESFPVRSSHYECTDESGQITFRTPVQPGSWGVEVRERETVKAPRVIRIAGDGHPVSAEVIVKGIDPAHTITGRVLDGNDRPVKDVWVKAVMIANRRRGGARPIPVRENESRWASTSETGFFSIVPRKGRPTGPVAVFVARNRRSDGWARLAESKWGAHGLKLRFDSVGTLSLEVRDSRGEPVSGYSAVVTPKSAARGQGTRRAVCKAVSGRVDVTNVTPGANTITITAFDQKHGWTSEEFVMPDAGNSECRIRLEPVVSHVVEVTDRDGNAVTGAEVDVVVGAIRGSFGRSRSVSFSVNRPPNAPVSTIPVKTGPDGRARLRAPRSEKPADIRVRMPGWLPATKELAAWPPAEDVTAIVLPKAATLTGRVRPVHVLRALSTSTPDGLASAARFGEKAVGYRMSVEDYRRLHNVGIVLISSIDKRPPRSTIRATRGTVHPVKGDGTFHIDGLGPGNYRVFLSVPRDATDETMHDLHRPHLATVDLVAGSTATVDLWISDVLPDGPSGRATLDDVPLANATIEMFPAKVTRRSMRASGRVRCAAVLRTDASGALLPRRVPPGEYRVVALVAEDGRAGVRRVPAREPLIVAKGVGSYDLAFSTRTVEYQFRNGRRQGHWILWHDHGVKRGEGSYDDGLREGPWTFWNVDGTVDENLTGSYEQGVLTLR